MKELSIRDIQTESLKILEDVHAFCVSMGITYSVAYGTLIGTIRHKGFIPWDDDVDIIMPRNDYDRFCREYISDDYVLECPERNQDYYLAFARVFDVKRTIAKSFVPWHNSESGVWIDVFPADFVSDDVSEFIKYKLGLQRKWAITAWGRWAKGRFEHDGSFGYYPKLFIKKVLTLNGLLTIPILRNFMRSVDKVKKKESTHWSQLSCLDGYEWHSIHDFQSTVLMPFEDTEVMVMNGWDTVLRECYGDYMQLPPEEKRIGHSAKLTKFYWR